MKKLIVMFILSGLCLIYISCDNSVSKVNKGTTSTPTSTPIQEILDNNAETALNEFIEKKYKDWKQIGLSDSIENCALAESCFIHLEKGSEGKLITIVFRKLRKQNGHYYWLVSEPTRYEIEKSTVESIRDGWAKEISESRDLWKDDEWSSIREMVIEELKEESETADALARDARDYDAQN